MNTLPELKRLLLAALVPAGLLCLSLALSACGGSGSGIAAGGAVAKELATGTVTGFGSTIVEGRKYEDGSASVLFEDDPANPRSGTTSDIRLGAQVEAKSAGGMASAILIRPEVVGMVTGLTGNGLTMAGVTVSMSADAASPTVFEGLSGLAEVAVGDFLEVHGQRDANNVLVATRVERRDASATLFTKVSGKISALDPSAKSFTMGGLTVNYAGAGKILPAAGALVNGARVIVFSTSAITGNVLNAQSLMVRGASAGSGETVRIGGRIQSLDAGHASFVLDGVTIDARSASWVGGTLLDLADGIKVRVAGTFVDGKLVAGEISLVKKAVDARVDLSGAITDYVSAASFKLRGVTIDASASTVSFVNGDASNLGNSVVVRIKGMVSADVVSPVSVEFVTSSADVNRAFVGVVTNYSAGSGNFTLMNVSMKLLGTTLFSNAEGTAASKSDFATGDVVSVKGGLVGGVFEVSSVTFRNGVATGASAVEGLVSAVDLGQGIFRLNGQKVRLVSGARIEGALSGLHNGARVEVSGQLVAGEFLVSGMEIKDPRPLDGSEVRGTVSSFSSSSDFRIGTVPVDASGAVFVRGTMADLGDGDFVEAEGKVVKGVLKVSRLKFQK